jgi:ADP-ribose pyrophosphatase YjhB (NUDIX family)
MVPARCAELRLNIIATRPVRVCPDCDFVVYENPKVVVGSVVAEGEDILLCRRAIEPHASFWTLPAGYLEMGETVIEGALREAWEEACARITIDGVLAVYSIARFGQVQVFFRAGWAQPGFAVRLESLEVRQFSWEQIPWDDIAFPSVRWALNAWYGSRGCVLPAAASIPEKTSAGFYHCRGSRRRDAASYRRPLADQPVFSENLIRRGFACSSRSRRARRFPFGQRRN